MAEGYGPRVAIALLTTYLAGYRVPLYERLAERYRVEVLCYGGGDRYVPPWFTDLDAQLAAAPFPARRLHGGPREAYAIGRRYDAVIAPFAGGAILPAAYFGARRFILWASVWSQPRSVRHVLALPVTRRIYRHADAVVAYGEHVRRFVASIRGRDDDVFVAPQSVEPELFARPVAAEDVAAFRAAHGLGNGPLALYVGRLVPEKGLEVLLEAWGRVLRAQPDATLVVVGDGPLAARASATERVRFLGPLARLNLPVAYAASLFALLPSIPTPLFREPWGLVCNEAMHQGRPVIASTAVGAVAGGLVRDGLNGVVVPPGDAAALAGAIETLLGDAPLRGRLGVAARAAVAPYTYEAMAAAFGLALERATAIRPSPTGP
jgi:glycosyltransferase involved in cell wall biosynthesis